MKNDKPTPVGVIADVVCLEPMVRELRRCLTDDGCFLLVVADKNDPKNFTLLSDLEPPQVARLLRVALERALDGTGTKECTVLTGAPTREEE